ncbi:MAG: hypothetical protein JWO19_1533 [Bryobacterales bacterium]|nr:hypothetical protein [Bryobacterales bacterium]
MLRKLCFLATLSAFLLGGSATAGTFGKVVSIGGEASDLALDEPRGVLYIANFTANRIDVMSLANNTILTSINIAAQPSSISLSPNGRWLLTTHFGNNLAPASPTNALTLIDLTANNAKQTFVLGNTPLGAAFGIDNKALVATTQNYLLFDPATGGTTVLDTVAGVTAKTIPVPPANFPSDITTASVSVSKDRLKIYGLGSSTGTVTFRYDVTSHAISPGGVVLASGTLGPRVVSLNDNGSVTMAGWVMVDSAGTFINNFAQESNEFSVGTTAFDDSRGLLYAQIPATKGEAPTLQILDSDNLTLRQRLRLPENTKGRSVLNQDSSILYSVSDSGVLVLPVGAINKSPRVTAAVKDLVFRGNFCDPRVATQTLTITDPGGGNTPFTISASAPGVTVSPASGVTPANVTVSVNPSVYQSQKGTVAVTLTLASSAAVNVPASIRVLINSREPDQRGTFLNIPGTLVDLAADPIRNRYYVLRQDTNEVLVYNSRNNTQTAALRTYNTPTSMAVTMDNRFLLVGHLNSQTLAVFDLETLQAQPYVNTEAGGGNVVRSLAVTTRGILATSNDFKGVGHILRVDLDARTSTQLPTLGVYDNKLPLDAVIAASPNGSKALIAVSDGTVYVYDANVDSFTVSRKDFAGLSGTYAASSLDQFVVGNNLLNSSGVPVAQFESATGGSSGFVFTGPLGIRTTAPDSASPGVIQRADLSNGSGLRPTHMVEAPLLVTSPGLSVFTRSLAMLPDGSMLISLTTSGITVLPISYDAAVAIPNITSVVSAADMRSAVAPGGLMAVLGTNLSGTNQATSEVPLPTVINDSCLTVNGQPVHMMFVSPTQVNAQMPAQAGGNVAIIMHTPGGVSNTFYLTVGASAPAVFLSGTLGDQTNLPTVVRWSNGLLVTSTNPVHRNDILVIYLTGLGAVNPSVNDGDPAPLSPLSETLTTPVVKIGGVEAPVLFSGLVPGYVGLYVLNISVPGTTPQGLSVPLTITQDGSVSYSQNVRVVQQN